MYCDEGDGWVFSPIQRGRFGEDDPDPVTDDLIFGIILGPNCIVDISGTPGNAVAIVGALGNGSFAGAAYTYRDKGGGWMLDGTVSWPSGPEAEDKFVLSVAISGTPGYAVVIVGVSGDDEYSEGYAAYTYRETTPCFHGSVLIDTDRGLIQARHVGLGTRVRCEDNRYCVVTHVTKSSSTPCVAFSDHCFAPNQPSCFTMVTPDHLIKLPNNKLMRAKEAMKFAKPGSARMSKPVTVYHIGFDDWTFLFANNMRMESLAWKDHHHKMRPFLKKGTN